MTSAVAAAVPDETMSTRNPQRALIRLLDDLVSVLLQTSTPAYTARPLPGVSGSVGEHVRHTLDHVAAFVSARPHGVLTYDRRDRGTPVETAPGAALRSILRLKALLADIDAATLDSPVAVTTTLERGAPPALVWSTLRRELAFVISHTIHHQALIATLLAIGGSDVPDAFGLAPSTPRPARS